MLKREELKELYGKANGPCVSLFMPVSRGESAPAQNSIRFKNLLKEAEDRLLDSGMRQAAVKEFLEPAQKLLAGELSWRQAAGLAVYVSADYFRYYQLTFEPEEMAVVAGHFYLKPLLRSLAANQQFYVLALSQNRVRLFDCTPQSIKEVDLELADIPLSLSEALKYDDPEKQIQAHSGPSAGAQIFHGHSLGDDAKINILRFFQLVDKGLRELLSGDRKPMVLAGVGFLLPIYREASSYPHLVDGGIEGNPDRMSVEEIHSKALPAVQPYFDQERIRAAEKYLQLAGTGLASADPREVVPAACHGRVEVLFTAAGHQLWGKYDPGSNRVELYEHFTPGSEDLLDKAAIETAISKGTVYIVDRDKIPGHTEMAAVFRY